MWNVYLGFMQHMKVCSTYKLPAQCVHTLTKGPLQAPCTSQPGQRVLSEQVSRETPSAPAVPLVGEQGSSPPSPASSDPELSFELCGCHLRDSLHHAEASVGGRVESGIK